MIGSPTMSGVLLHESRCGQSLAVLVLTCALGLQVWVLSLGAQPAFRWAKQAGGEASDYGFDIVTDGTGSVYVGGGFYSTNALFDGTMVTNSGTDGAFL